MDQTTETTMQYCSIHSSSVQEPLIGSAPRTDYWVLLEYPYPLSAKALEENRLPDTINAYLHAVLAALPASRLLYIRTKSSSSTSSPRLFLADGRAEHANLQQIHLNRYDDLLGLDIPALFNKRAKTNVDSGRETLYLVCTNGKRDICCSKWGLPLYNALQKMYGDAIWQSSHVGGHRFAPNLICLPHGLYFGRVPQNQAARIVEQYASGRLVIDYFRGYAAYPAAAQAAEHFLRLHTGEDRIGAYHLDSLSPIADNQWDVRFTSTKLPNAYRIKIEHAQASKEIFENCNTPSERKSFKEFRLLQPIQPD